MTTLGHSQAAQKLSTSFFLFLFYIVVWWLQLGERLGKRFGTDIRLEAIIAVVLLFSTFFDSFRRRADEKADFAPFIITLFSVMILQVIFAWNIDRAWFVFTERVLKYSVMGLLISRFVRTPRQLGWFIFVWLLACWKGTLEGVIGGITGSLIWENQGIMRLHGVGLWSHFNSFSQFALGVIPFCFYLYPVVKIKWMKIGILSLVCFSTYVVIYTGSRTGYLGFLIMISLFYFQSSRKVRLYLIAIVIIMTPVTIVFLPSQYQERFMSSFSGREKEGASKESRMKLYREGWYVFKQHPFGVGVGNYPEAGQKYFDYNMEQHCLYTEVLTELGIQGFIVFMLLMWKINSTLNTSKNKLMSMLEKYETTEDHSLSLMYDLRLTYAVVQSTLVYFLLRLFLDIFGMDLYAIPWWFVIGIASSTFFIVNNLRSQLASK